MRSILLGFALGCMLVLSGCADPYGAALKAHNAAAVLINNADKTVDLYRQNGVITEPEELQVLNYLEFAELQNESFLGCANIAHVNNNPVGSYTKCAQVVIAGLQDPKELALLNLSSTAGTQAVFTVAQGLISAANAVITALAGA